MKHSVVRREQYDYRQTKPLSPLAVDCVLGDVDFERAVQLFMLQMVYLAIKKHNGNQTEAAKQLGINRTTLNQLLRRAGVTPRLLHQSEICPDQETRRLANSEAHRSLAAYIAQVSFAEGDQLCPASPKQHGGLECGEERRE